LSTQFRHITVCLHANEPPATWAAWRLCGLNPVLGADPKDETSLVRLANLFRQHETMTTNAYGSHIAYAAAFGCRVSVCHTETSDTASSNVVKGRKNNAALRALYRSFSINQLNALNRMQPLLFCPPLESRIYRSWGFSQIGADNIQDGHFFRRTLLNRPLANAIAKTALALPGVKSAMWRVVSDSSSIARLESMNVPGAVANSE